MLSAIKGLLRRLKAGSRRAKVEKLLHSRGWVFEEETQLWYHPEVDLAYDPVLDTVLAECSGKMFIALTSPIEEFI